MKKFILSALLLLSTASAQAGTFLCDITDEPAYKENPFVFKPTVQGREGKYDILQVQRWAQEAVNIVVDEKAMIATYEGEGITQQSENAEVYEFQTKFGRRFALTG